MKNLIVLGKITKNQGNKGELRIAPYTEDLRRFDLLDEVILVSPDRDKKVTKSVEDIWLHKNFVIMKLEGINDIGQALEFRNFIVKIKEDELLPLAEDEFYVDDLIDSSVLLPDQKQLGKVLDVIDTAGGTDILLIKGSNKEYMIPMSREYIKEIDIENKKIFIDPVNGILNL